MNIGQLKQCLFTEWRFKVAQMTLLQERDGQQVYKLSDHNQLTYILKLYGANAAQEQIKNNIDVLNFAYSRGIPCPRVVQTIHDTSIHSFNGRLLFLQEFIDGVIPEANEDIYSTLGGLISRVHAIHDCPVMSDMNIPLIKDQLLSLGASYNMPKQFFKDVEGIPDFTKLPTSLVHTDLALRNTMIDKKGQFFLIDWDDAGQGITLLDTAYILVTLFDNKGSFNDMAATAFYEAYQKNRPFTDLEIALFFDAVLFWLLRYAVIDQVGMIESNWKKAIFWKKSGYQLLDKAQIIKSP